jgi:hypothetical protein
VQGLSTRKMSLGLRDAKVPPVRPTSEDKK